MKTPYEKFINSNAVQYHCHEAALIDEGGTDMHAYNAKEKELVIKEFNHMSERLKELEKPRVDPCPHCQCSELLCGYPKKCSSEKT